MERMRHEMARDQDRFIQLGTREKGRELKCSFPTMLSVMSGTNRRKIPRTRSMRMQRRTRDSNTNNTNSQAVANTVVNTEAKLEAKLVAKVLEKANMANRPAKAVEKAAENTANHLAKVVAKAAVNMAMETTVKLVFAGIIKQATAHVANPVDSNMQLLADRNRNVLQRAERSVSERNQW